jgi:hypothetical protein
MRIRKRRIKLNRLVLIPLAGAMPFQFGNCTLDNIQEQAAIGLETTLVGLFTLWAEDLAETVFRVD